MSYQIVKILLNYVILGSLILQIAAKYLKESNRLEIIFNISIFCFQKRFSKLLRTFFLQFSWICPWLIDREFDKTLSARYIYVGSEIVYNIEKFEICYPRYFVSTEQENPTEANYSRHTWTRAKNTLIKETQAKSETTDTDNQEQKDNISSDEEFDTKEKWKSIPFDKSHFSIRWWLYHFLSEES